MLTDIVSTEFGSILLSLIIGFGMASFFRKICKKGKCIVIQGPDVKTIQDTIYKMDNECYRYTPKMTKCNKQD